MDLGRTITEVQIYFYVLIYSLKHDFSKKKSSNIIFIFLHF